MVNYTVRIFAHSCRLCDLHLYNEHGKRQFMYVENEPYTADNPQLSASVTSGVIVS